MQENTGFIARPKNGFWEISHSKFEQKSQVKHLNVCVNVLWSRCASDVLFYLDYLNSIDLFFLKNYPGEWDCYFSVKLS